MEELKTKTYKVKNGKWVIGNLYDALVACRFDQFINAHRTPKLTQNVSLGVNLKKHNYQFNFKS